MAARIRMISHWLTTDINRLFLIDGLGASVSAFFLGVVLIRFENTFGMPRSVLYFLALLPCIFAIYSFGCYFFVKGNHRSYLRGVAVANLLYCVLTIGLVIFHFESLTLLGLLYFFIELIVIVLLVSVELRA